MGQDTFPVLVGLTHSHPKAALRSKGCGGHGLFLTWNAPFLGSLQAINGLMSLSVCPDSLMPAGFPFPPRGL